MNIEDPRIIDAKAIPMREVAERLGIAGLKHLSGELIGPCPVCGGRDRFGINLRSNAFNCRKCGLRGGDQIALVMGVLGLKFFERDTLSGKVSFPPLDWLCGNAPVQVDEKELERRRAAAKAADQKQRDEADKYRRWAIADAQKIWGKAVDPARSTAANAMLHGYLASRGFDRATLAGLPRALRYLDDHPYVRKIGGQLVTLHRGPCMIGCVLSQRDELVAVHQTWFDRAAPHRKATISHEGEDYPAKMVRGAVKGGAIRLSSPAQAGVMVMGEGIETTLSAMAADAVPGAAYWAGVSLGNMAGKMEKVPGVRTSGLPLMEDRDAFVPPPRIERLIFIQDGDSAPKPTRAKLEAGLRRAMRRSPKLKAQIVHAGNGIDLNDLLIGKGAD